MRIEYSAIKIAYEGIRQVFGQWLQYSVIWINRASIYLQNSPQSYVALIGANIVFFEITISICSLANYIFNSLGIDYQDLEGLQQKKRCVGMEFLFIGILASLNWTFYKVFRLPLSSRNVIAVSLTTSLVYLYCK